MKWGSERRLLSSNPDRPDVRLWVIRCTFAMSARCPFSPQLPTYLCAALSVSKGLNAYSTAFAAFSMSAAISRGCKRKMAWGPGSSMVWGLSPLRHETLQVRVDHPVLLRNHGIARLILPTRDCDLRLQGFVENRNLRNRHEVRDRLGNASGEVGRKRFWVDGQITVADQKYAHAGRRHLVGQISQNSHRRRVLRPLHKQEP